MARLPKTGATQAFRELDEDTKHEMLNAVRSGAFTKYEVMVALIQAGLLPKETSWRMFRKGWAKNII